MGTKKSAQSKAKKSHEPEGKSAEGKATSKAEGKEKGTATTRTRATTATTTARATTTTRARATARTTKTTARATRATTGKGTTTATGTSAKGTASGERAIFGKLAPAVREAFSVAAQEVFFENIEQAVDDPQGLLDEGNMGQTYQSFHRGIVTPEQMAEAFVALGPWLSPGLLESAFKRASPRLTVGQFVGDLYDVILLEAAIDIAEGIVKRALKKPLPPRLAPYEEAIGALAARLARAIEEGDSEEQNLDTLIFGGK